MNTPFENLCLNHRYQILCLDYEGDFKDKESLEIKKRIIQFDHYPKYAFINFCEIWLVNFQLIWFVNWFMLNFFI